MRVAGLISGTSADGIDVAVVDIGERVDVVAATTVPYAPEVRSAILSVSDAASIARLNFLLGELFAEALGQTGVPLETIELIGSHGQTIFHEGRPVEFLGRKVAGTMQIGEAAVIAERTGIETIADFRAADIAAGGQGAPLVPFLDYELFRHPDRARIALNIGGIANVTVIPAGAAPEDVIAFDTGPGNMVMDALAPPFDRNGERARAGHVNVALLERLLADPYYRGEPPKSCGREEYGGEFVQRTGIDITTAAELTARTIALAVEGYPATQEVIVSGGGVHNLYLMERLRALLRPRATTSAEFGIDPDVKEAILFAVLAYQTYQRRAGNLPSATGARKPVILGKISPGTKRAPGALLFIERLASMFCTKCGVELREQDKFCYECGNVTGKGAPPPLRPQTPLSRPMNEAKIAGVCAGFARSFGLDVTLVRVVWIVLCVWPLPVFGVIAYIVAWIVMPKDPLALPAAPQMKALNGPAN